MAGRPTNHLAYKDQTWFKSEGRYRPATELSETQLRFIEWLLNPSTDKGTHISFAKENGIADRTLYAWKKNKLFRDAWERRAAEINGGVERTQKVVDAMYEKALAGDVKAMTSYLNYVEKFSPTPIKKRELDLSDLTDEEVATLAANVVELRSRTA